MDAFASDNVLLLADQPAGAMPGCAAMIAALCRAGRPPFVVVLADGPAPAADEAALRAGLAAAGLDGRLLMFGLPGVVPEAGAVFEAAVRALGFVTWRRDCTLIVTAGAGASRVAQAAVAESGLRVTAA